MDLYLTEEEKNYFYNSNWIFNNILEDNEFRYLHFPLILKTTNQLLIQSYAEAVIVFVKLMNLEKQLYLDSADKLVLILLKNQLPEIRQQCISNIFDSNFYKKTMKLYKIIHKWFPVLCIDMEKCFFKNKSISYYKFKRLYEMLKYLIAINYLNPPIEVFLMRINKQAELNPEIKFLIDKTFYKNNFSHINYFNDTLNKLKAGSKKSNNDIYNFCWNVGFSKDAVGDGCAFENPETVCQTLNLDIMLNNEFIPAEFYYPSIEFDFSETPSNDVERILSLAKLLQINLEFRHYWDLRFSRNLRKFIDNEDLTTWTFEDYEKHYFKIK